jgi:hypothetical protein
MKAKIEEEMAAKTISSAAKMKEASGVIMC